MNKTLGAFYQAYKNKNAVNFVLSNFKTHFPNSPVTLISDGGEDFTEISKIYNTSFHMMDNLYIRQIPYNSIRIKEWWRRHKLTCEECNTDYILILEDDVFITKHFFIHENFYLRGVDKINPLSQKMCEDIKKFGNVSDNIFYYGMCGGGIYHRETFLNLYDDIIADIEANHDNLIQDPQYFLLGVVDANIVYHFNKRGFHYEGSPWICEVKRQSNCLNYPIIHQWLV